MKQKMYSLFQVSISPTGRRTYRPVSALEFPKQIAIRVFQDRLLAGIFNGERLELRPVRNQKKNNQ